MGDKIVQKSVLPTCCFSQSKSLKYRLFPSLLKTNNVPVNKLEESRTVFFLKKTHLPELDVVFVSI